MQQRTEAVQQLEAEHADGTQRGYTIDDELRENRERISQIALEIDRAHARRRHNEERCAELLVRAASSEAELAQARHRLTALESERESNRQILESAAADLAAAQSDLRSASKRLPQQPRASPKSSASRKNPASPSSILCRPRRGCAINWRRPKNVWLASIAKLAVWKPKSRNANTQVEAFGGQRGQLALEFETVTPARQWASPKKSANCAG